MPSVIITPHAREGLERCRNFLANVSPQSAQKASQAIGLSLKSLEGFPGAGRIDEIEPSLRELIIPFGDSGYVALYQYDEVSDEAFILAFRHQKEAGF